MAKDIGVILKNKEEAPLPHVFVLRPLVVGSAKAALSWRASTRLRPNYSMTGTLPSRRGDVRREPLRAEGLESRVLFSASPLAAPLDVHPDEMSAPAAILVDASLEDVDRLLEGLSPDAHVLMYDSGSESIDDLVGRVTDLVSETGQRLDSLSILSHGRSGAFQLGSEWVSRESLADDVWAEVGDALDENGNIYIFSCDVASDPAAGQGLLDALARASGADVFASDDTTGAGGDWDLEAASTGDEAELANGLDTPVHADLLAEYGYSLADFSDAAFTGTQTFNDDSQTFTLTVTGAGTVNFAYDGTSDTLQILGTAGTDATTAISITDDDGTADMVLSGVTLDGDTGSLASNVTIDALTLNQNLTADLAVHGNVGTLTTANLNANLGITGDLDSASIDSVMGGAALTAGNVTGTFDFTDGGTSIYSGTVQYAYAVQYGDGELLATESIDFEDYDLGGVDGVDGWDWVNEWNSGSGYTGVIDLAGDQMLEFSNDATAGLTYDIAQDMEIYDISWTWRASSDSVNQVVGLMDGSDGSLGWSDFGMRIILNDDGNLWLRGDTWINTGIAYGTAEHDCRLVLNNDGANSTWSFYFDGELVGGNLNTSIDLSTNTMDYFTLRANGAGGQYLDDLTIVGHVGGVWPNSAPVAQDGTLSVDELATDGTSIGSAVGMDGDPGDAVTFAITAGNDDGVFTIDPATGEITVIDNTNLDYESVTQYSLSIEVVDSFGLTDAATVTINVLDAMDTPTQINNETVFVAFQGARRIGENQLLAGDVDSSLTYVLTSGPSHGTLMRSGTVLNVGDSFTKDDLENGRIVYAHTGSDHTGDSYTIEIRQDNGPETLSITQQVTIEDSLAEFSFDDDASPTGGLSELTVSPLDISAVSGDIDTTETNSLYWSVGQDTLNESEYIEFSVTSTDGLSTTYRQLSLLVNDAASGRGGTIYLRSSQDGFAANVGSALVNEGNIWEMDLLTFDLSSLDAAVGTTFRLYATREGSSNPGIGGKLEIREMDVVGNLHPNAAGESAEVSGACSVEIDVLANDTDTAGENLSIHSYYGVEHGSVSVVDGKLVYTAETGYGGTDTFTYVVSDGRGGLTHQDVTVTIDALPIEESTESNSETTEETSISEPVAEEPTAEPAPAPTQPEPVAEEEAPTVPSEPDTAPEPTAPMPEDTTSDEPESTSGSDTSAPLDGQQDSIQDPIEQDSGMDDSSPVNQPESPMDESLDGEGASEDDVSSDGGGEDVSEDAGDSGEATGDGQMVRGDGGWDGSEGSGGGNGGRDVRGRVNVGSVRSGRNGNTGRDGAYGRRTATATTGMVTVGSRDWSLGNETLTGSMIARRSSYDSVGRDSGMWREMDQVAQQQQEGARTVEVATRVTAGTVVGLSTAASIGYLVWSVKSGALLSSFVAALPSWRVFDPLPILEYHEAKSSGKNGKRKSGFVNFFRIVLLGR